MASSTPGNKRRPVTSLRPFRAPQQGPRGSAPAGRPARDDNAPDSVVAWAHYLAGRRQPNDDLEAATRMALDGHGFIWLGLKDPSDEDMARFAKQFNLHPLAIEDAVEGHTRSKLEQFGDTLFCVVSTVAYVDHTEITDSSEIVSTGQVMIFVGNNFVMTVRRGEHAQLRTLRARMEAQPERLTHGPAEILYAVLDKIIDDYIRVVHEFEKDIDEIEAAVFSRQRTHEINRVYNLKRELIEFKRCVVPLGPPLQALASRPLAAIPEQSRAYFRELSDHHLEAREAVHSFDEVLSTILAAALARASVEDNQDMRKISAAVAIFAVPTMIAGIYGMNFDNMPELHWQYGYFMVWGAIIALMLGLYIGFRRNGWL